MKQPRMTPCTSQTSCTSQTFVTTRSSTFVALLALASSAVAGCGLQARLTASASGDLATHASAELQRHWDDQLVGDAMPATLVQLEGVFAVVPDDTTIGLELARAYVAYAFGWVEDEADLAEAAGDLDEATAIRNRARLLYERARNIAIHLLRQRDHGLDAALHDEAARTRWLEAHVRSDEDARLALWAGIAWGSAIGASGGDPELVADLGTARALVERSIAIDETLEHAAGLSFVAGLMSATSAGLGGEPERGQQLFERALLGTGRATFSVQLAYASTYAVTAGDRTLFVTLLREIIDGGDPDIDQRLGNRVARRRAIHLLRRVDELF